MMFTSPFWYFISFYMPLYCRSTCVHINVILYMATSQFFFRGSFSNVLWCKCASVKTLHRKNLNVPVYVWHVQSVSRTTESYSKLHLLQFWNEFSKIFLLKTVIQFGSGRQTGMNPKNNKTMDWGKCPNSSCLKSGWAVPGASVIKYL